jgi:hypothetical protein
MIVAMSAIGFVGLDGLLQRPPVNELSQLNPTTNIVNLHLTIRWVSPLTRVAKIRELKAGCLQDCPRIILFVQVAVHARGRTNPLNGPELCDELAKALPLIVHHISPENLVNLRILPKTVTR